MDRFDEVFDALEGAAPNPFASDFSKPAFDQIQPGRTGGSEMQMKSSMALQPSLHFGMFVGGVVVHDQMQLHCGGGFPIYLTQEAQKLIVPMPIKAATNDRAFQHIQSGKQCGGAMPHVIVSHG